jgi:hypothetical protein
MSMAVVPRTCRCGKTTDSKLSERRRASRHSDLLTRPKVDEHFNCLQPSTLAVQPTVAWSIAAPRSNSARTHSTCPLWLAMYSGVAPLACNTTPCAQYSLYHMTAAADHHGAVPSPHVHHRQHPYSPKPSTAIRPSAPHKLHMYARCLPHIPAHTQPPQYSAIQVEQPTVARLIAAPRSNSARTHSTCPFLLAIYSGVAPLVCNTTPWAQYSLYHMSAAADDQGAPTSPHRQHELHHHSSTPSTACHTIPTTQAALACTEPLAHPRTHTAPAVLSHTG